MCGRFTLTWDHWRRIADTLGVEDEGEAAASYRPRFNIAPTDEHFIITSEFEVENARGRWGLVNRWAKDNRRASQCINAKAETLEQLPTFREAFRQRRCVVPADGFFEWVGPKTKRQPLWIHARAGGLLLFAGLYQSWYPEKDRARADVYDRDMRCECHDRRNSRSHAGGARRARGGRLDERT